MRRPLLQLLCLLLASSGLALGPSAAVSPVLAAADEEIDELELALRRANNRSDPQDGSSERAEVLAQLIATGEDEALDVIRDSFGTYSRRRREAQHEAEVRSYALERKRIVLEEARVRAEAGGAREVLQQLEAEIDTLEEELADKESKSRRYGLVADELGAGAVTLFETFGARKRRRLEGRIWDSALEGEDDGSDVQRRIGAVELLGMVGGPGTAEGCQELVARVNGMRVRLRRELPPLELEVRKFQQRIQQEQEANAGGFSGATKEQYDAAVREASVVVNAMQRLSFLIDAGVEAGGAALAREPDEMLPQTLAKLMRAQRRADDGLRGQTLRMVALGSTPMVLDALQELLSEEREPLARAQLIDGLARAGDERLVPQLIATHLSDESWHVRARAVAALEHLRHPDGVPALIARLELEDGRLSGDIAAALRSLTHQRFAARHELWSRWWSDNAAGFEVPAAKTAEDLVNERLESVGLSFFGVQTYSERVLYIIDVSGSMLEPMYLRTDGRGGETRLEAAQRELIRSLGQLPDGATFNIVTYATDMEPWQRGMLTMDEDTRAEAIAFVEGLAAVGGTNIHGCLQLGFELAEVEPGDEWSDPKVDTFFLLTDGMASVGVTISQEQILDFASEMNESAGIVIHTIGLGHEQDAYLLRGLAEQNGGTYAAR